ncbi:MAG: EAL domain-containing protein [Chromatiales bacterium]|nr:MAG: EAL domain-containing protein [Chromatiales bacterium]
MTTNPSTESPSYVLVADDDATFRLLYEQTLGAAGFQVVTCADGHEVLAAIDGRWPDILLLDVEMPGLDGFDVCKKIRKQYPDFPAPVVMITGNDKVEAVKRAYEVGATDFIHKPVTWAALPFKLHYLLRSYRALLDVRADERKMRALLEAIPELIFVVDQTGTILESLSGPVSGAPTPDLAGRRLEAVLPPDTANDARESLHAALASGQLQTYTYAWQDGRTFETRMVANSATTVVTLIRDISEQVASEKRIKQLAYYDQLTGLPNRQQFIRDLRRALARAARGEQKLAVLFLDLDRFKRINDTLGHTVGDALLKSVAERLGASVRLEDTVGRIRLDIPQPTELARLGGDEFVILIAGLDEVGEVEKIVTRIRAALTEPFSYEGHQFVITPSIGVAMYPDHGRSMEELLMHADMAMYQAKAAGRNGHRFFSSSKNTRSLERLDLENELRAALEEGAFSLHYQPKVDIASWQVVGCEALLRWQHPERGWISPGEFVPLAEETGLILPLGRWVVEETCRQLKAWHAAGFDDLTVAVNVSSQQFTQSDLLDSVLQIIWAAGLKAQCLEVEITESLLMQNVDETRDVLRKFREAGIKLTVDDFGTGYSSLSYLTQFPLQSLKIDRSFVRNLHVNRQDAAICSAIIAMSKELGLQVVAEGVELEEQLDYLRQHECDQIQGFLFSKPLPADEFIGLLAKDGSASSAG